MSLPVRQVFLTASAAVALVFPCELYAATSDAEVAALRKELAEMRHEMLGEIHELRARVAHYEHTETRTGGRSRVALENTRPHRVLRPADGSEPAPVFAQQADVHRLSGPRPPEQSRVASSEGPPESWSDFRAASAKDETVQVGGMKIGFPNGRPTIASEDQAYSFSIGLTAQEDIGGFLGAGPRGGEGAGNFNKFTQNLRRARIYLTWRYKDWVVNVTPDFGSSSVDGTVGLFEANLNYTGLRHTILTVGYFQPRGDEESAERANAFEFLERPTIVDLVRNIAGGVARFSVGGEHYEKRWAASAYFTGQKFGDRTKDTTITDSQTGGVVRVSGRPYVSKDVDVYMGAGATSAFKVNQGSSGRTYTFSDNMEVPLGETSLLTSGALKNVAQIWAAGPDFAVRWRNFLVKAGYYHVGVERSHQAGIANLPSLGFDGWYVAANYTLFGHPRVFNEKTAAFTTPGVEYDFDPSKNHWGAMEVSGRWSVTDLYGVANQGGTGINGNQQSVWEGGFNWYPTQHVKFMIDYARYIVSESKGVSGNVNLLGRSGNSIVGRVQATF
ncbi:porin [Acetobacter musti]|uniref:Porin n=1 Tax=Acetobacter musti TaxID=864732 RepID=A0ABX0JTY9_9PROT|nr:porin [Acetobacter musti]NHN85430.1 porin [Acetobacter musti]